MAKREIRIPFACARCLTSGCVTVAALAGETTRRAVERHQAARRAGCAAWCQWTARKRREGER